ncbi:hypothetical protein C9374_005040 [Naegleria lovaniensis]|uniref:Uncharacterized protein n=1 Tax=Naegleria lovaniensis TaxID=51637 RepID=A0AA88KKA2_NAELO|nr:uncharacterized protein C9374_005040 [Naegleria lovaniensis]KAG2382460.1 hypothetical protein C9374_005040 [Naegleria lovaniensis]
MKQNNIGIFKKNSENEEICAISIDEMPTDVDEKEPCSSPSELCWKVDNTFRSNKFICYTTESYRFELLMKESQPKRGRGRPRKPTTTMEPDRRKSNRIEKTRKRARSSSSSAEKRNK